MIVINLTSNKWLNLKSNFRIDKLILVGPLKGYYKGYFICHTRKNAIYFKFDSTNPEVSLIDKSLIKFGNLTSIVSLSDAADYLRNEVYNLNRPNKDIIKEILHFVEINR